MKKPIIVNSSSTPLKRGWKLTLGKKEHHRVGFRPAEIRAMAAEALKDIKKAKVDEVVSWIDIFYTIPEADRKVYRKHRNWTRLHGKISTALQSMVRKDKAINLGNPRTGTVGKGNVIKRTPGQYKKLAAK